MSNSTAHLDISKLEKAKTRGNKTIARCPACAEDDSDSAGDHLVIFPSGKFGCIAHEKDGDHRKRIFALVGVKDERTTPPSSSGGLKPWKKPIERIHDYRDKDGNILFQVVIHGRDDQGKKDCCQRQPDKSKAHGWAWSLKGIPKPLPLFHLPELLASDPDGAVWIVEGEKDADIVATRGRVATCNSGGAGKWNHTDQEPLRNRRVIISPDNDPVGRRHAEQVARSLSGVARSISVVDWPKVWPTMPEKADIGDAIEDGSTLDDIEAVAVPWTPQEQPDPNPTAPTPPPAPDSIVEELEPWETPVDLGELVAEIEARIGRHLIMPAESRLALSLWVASSYVFDSFRCFPRVVVHSPEKRCGKTTLLEILKAVVPRGLLASSISPAALFRVIEDYRPTLLIDEADAFLNENEPLRGIINSSHTKAGAFVLRCDGDQNKVRKFSTWAPLVLGGIKRVADTIMDRSIVIELQRKGRGEPVERIPVELDERLLDLRRKLARWSEDNANILRNANPSLPDTDNDRARDNWLPLFAVADAMGGDWRDRTTGAFLSMAGEGDTETLGTMLLADIRTAFTTRSVDRVWTCDLLHDLTNMEERPWANWRGEFKARIMSNMLKDYRIFSVDIRMAEGRVKKGYIRAKCEDAFARYLPPEG